MLFTFETIIIIFEIEPPITTTAAAATQSTTAATESDPQIAHRKTYTQPRTWRGESSLKGFPSNLPIVEVTAFQPYFALLQKNKR